MFRPSKNDSVLYVLTGNRLVLSMLEKNVDHDYIIFNLIIYREMMYLNNTTKLIIRQIQFDHSSPNDQIE